MLLHRRSVHFGVKPNKCATCGKGYRTKNELYRHAENCPAAAAGSHSRPPSASTLPPPQSVADTPPTASVTAAAAVALPQIPEPPSNLQPSSAAAVSVTLPQQPILPVLSPENTPPSQQQSLPPLRESELLYQLDSSS